MKKGWLLTDKDTSGVAKNAGEIAQKKEHNWPMVSFIHNECKVILGWGITSKPKRQNPKQSDIFKIRTSFLNLKLQIIRLTEFVDRKVAGLMPKYYLPASWRYRPGLYFFPYIRLK